MASDTTTSEGAKAWLLAHERSAKKVTLGLVLGGALFVVLGMFIQLWSDVGWVPFSELGSVQYGTDDPLPGLGDFWGMMLIGVVLVPAILGGAGYSEARKRARARKRLVPLLLDENRRDATVIDCSWSSSDNVALMHVKDAAGAEHRIRDANAQGHWQVNAGAAVGLWVAPTGRLAVGTGAGVVGS